LVAISERRSKEDIDRLAEVLADGIDASSVELSTREVERSTLAGEAARSRHRRVPDHRKLPGPPAVLVLRGPSMTADRSGTPPPRARQKCTIGMIRIATMLATLIIGLIAGPAVSL
jgi:hypothetical protein